jgi:hypothetical protein
MPKRGDLPDGPSAALGTIPNIQMTRQPCVRHRQLRATAMKPASVFTGVGSNATELFKITKPFMATGVAKRIRLSEFATAIDLR